MKFMSVGDLLVNRPYPILKMENKDTQYGRAVLCTLSNKGGGLIEVYLPRPIEVTDDEILEFNSRGRKYLTLLFKGRRGRAFDIEFE